MLSPVEIARQAPQLSNPNLLINGDFQILQRTTATVTGAETFVADRWKAAFAGSAASANRQTGGAGTRMDFVGGADTTYGWLRQRLEKRLTERYVNGVTVTIQARIFSNCTVLRNVALSAQKPASGIDDDWSLGWSNFVTGPSVTLPNDSTFHTYEATLDIAYADLQHGLGFGIEFANGIGSGEVISITDFKVEIGPVATPFQKRQPAEELALCQRYFEKWDTGNFTFYAGAAIPPKMQCQFAVVKRIAPSMVVAESGSSNLTSLTTTSSTPDHFVLYPQATAVGQVSVNNYTMEADAEL